MLTITQRNSSFQKIADRIVTEFRQIEVVEAIGFEESLATDFEKYILDTIINNIDRLSELEGIDPARTLTMDNKIIMSEKGLLGIWVWSFCLNTVYGFSIT